MKRILLILAICLSSAGIASAQSYGNDMKQIYSINWQINVPVGSSTDFVSNTTCEGININWAYFVTGNLAVGLDVGYTNYHQKFSQRVYRPNENTAINAAQYRYTQTFPIKAQVKYFFTPNNMVKAYAGLGMGAMSAGQHIVIQDFDAWDNNWGFLLSPEIGVLIPFGMENNWGANITAGYNWSTNKSTVGNIKVDDRQSFYMNFGLYLALF
ncbi:MAG: outer membrane beta-barrel protein [Bacteroidales bacterium]|jgi:outer membrane protein W|nr:outer membrane beta-barrel protein [Bacteroidales bacterium]MBQ5827320.1 outer membrane beta-barrel protein [Bacteroidales bacterium]